MAQLGSASALGAEGPRFESGYPDSTPADMTPAAQDRQDEGESVPVVVVEDTLAEVEDDLAHGDHASARRRLRDALVIRPHRLDLRLRLAAVYRDLGDLPQAGRWGFLADEAPQDEVQAFRTACGDDAALMLEALAWGEDDEGDEEDAVQVTATAWERIATLRRSVSAARRQDTGGHSHRHRSERAGGHPPATPYPFTPPTGITRPAAEPAVRPARLRERFGLALIFLGLLTVLAFLLIAFIGVVWAISDVVRDAYL